MGSPDERRDSSENVAQADSSWRWHLGALAVAASVCWDCREPQPPTEIFEGVTYGREWLETSQEGSGVIHWVRIDLTAPGIGLYVTPLDPSAACRGLAISSAWDQGRREPRAPGRRDQWHLVRLKFSLVD